jgi:hypothetical protein
MSDFYWRESDPLCVYTIDAVAVLCSVKPTDGMWNTFNDMQRAGWLDGTTNVGDVQARWLAWLLRDAGRFVDSAGAAVAQKPAG